MSGRKKAPPTDDDDCEYVASGNDVEVSVIRSADAKRSKITISLSSTLNALKDLINSDKTLGPCKRSQQRLFYMGRELTSGNRSLELMGIGKHNVFSIHLHSLAPKTVDLQSDDESEVVAAKMSVRRKKKSNAAINSNGGGGNATGGGVIDLAGSASFSSTSAGAGGGLRSNNSMNNQRQQPQQQGGQEKVVDLLDSDSDDDVVEIVETAHKRRRRG